MGIGGDQMLDEGSGGVGDAAGAGALLEEPGAALVPAYAGVAGVSRPVRAAPISCVRRGGP